MSTNEQIIKRYIANSEQRRWTDAQIAALSPKLRGELSKYAEKDGKAIGRVHPDLKDLIAQRGFMPADGLAALTMVQDKTINPMTQSNPEWILSKGGNETTTLDKSTLFMLNGDRVVRPLTPIPANPKIPDNYENLDALTAFCGTLVSHSDGEWSNVSEQAWVRTFPTLNSAGVKAVACFVAQLLNQDEGWKAMPQTAKASMTGRNGAVFIRDVFNGLSRHMFNYLNTMVVIEAFGVLTQARDGTWEYGIDEEGNEKIPSKVYTVQVKDVADIKFSQKYPAVFLYKGGWIPKGRMGKVDTTQTGSVLAARQRVIDVARGDSCIPALIAKSKDFSGITTEAAKVHYFLISSCLAAWQRGKIANIRLSKDGDIKPLYCSLTFWKEHAKKHDDRYKAMSTIESPWFYFLTAKRNAHLNVSLEIKELIIHSHQSGAVAITYLDDTIKTKVDKTSDPVNHDVMSRYVLPVDLPVDYIVKCPIYGTAFFPDDSALNRLKTKATKGEDIGKQYQGVKVYAHGNAMDFYGVASTFEDLSLVGAEPAPKGEKGMKLVDIPLTKFATREAWYENVYKDARAVYQAVFSPKKTYSSITNLLVITKGKVTILEDLNAEGSASAYSGKVFAKGGYERKKFTLPGATVAISTPVQTSGIPTGVTTQTDFIDTMGPPPGVVPPPPAPPKKKMFILDLPNQDSLKEVKDEREEEKDHDAEEDEESEDGEEKYGEKDDNSEDEAEEEENMVDLNDD